MSEKANNEEQMTDKAPEIQVPASGLSADNETPPHIPPHVLPPADSPPVLSGSPNIDGQSNSRIIKVIAIILLVVVLAILVAVIGSSISSTTNNIAVGGQSPGDGGSRVSAPTPAPAPVYVQPVSKALDDKNGFKDFRFGMTIDEAKGVLEPTSITHNPGNNSDLLLYSGTVVNRIGEFATDSLVLRFYEGRLFRIDISFSSNANEIYEALKINYGEPSDNGTWTRGEEPLIGKCWQGEKVFAVILAPSSRIWESVVIYDLAANKIALEYANAEPDRAAKDFSTNGFKLLTMGMNLQSLSIPFVVTEDNKATGVKKITFNSGDWLFIGFYSLQNVSCEFFKDRLYRIDLGFDQHRKEIFQTFQSRFGPLQSNNTWTRGDVKLTGKGGGDVKLYGVILAPGGASGSEDWDSIVLLDNAIQMEAQQFALTVPIEAAKDFSTNGFKSLVMGMHLQDVTATYTVSDSSEVTGVKKIIIRQGDLLSIGFYPLQYISCEFFKDRLYRIDLEFYQNRKEIFQTFQNRFAPLLKNETWTQGSEKLTAKSGGGIGFYGTILAPGDAYGGEEWETIILLDLVVQREAEQFKLDAPKRAAKDL
jgi:hypothetical protein